MLVPRRTLRVAAATAAGLALLASCTATGGSSDDDPDAARSTPASQGLAAPSPAGTPTSASPSSASAAPSRPPSGAGVAPAGLTLAFAGDVHFVDRTRARLDRDADTAVGPMSPALRAADLAMVNLETAITERGTPQPKSYRFRAPATAFAALRAAGVDVTTMANNHGLDYGPVGLRDSLAAIADTGFPVVGIGADAAAAFRPHIATVRGQRVAFLAATQIIDVPLRPSWTATTGRGGVASALDPAPLVAAVRAARRTADVVVVYLHWGQERNPCPVPVQRRLARELVAAGADVLVGTHAHTLLGAGYLGRSYVSYGLGNFVWYSSNSVSADTTGVLTLTLTGRRVTRAGWSPARIGGSGAPEPVDGAAADRARDRWAGLRSCTGLASAPS